MFRPILTPAAAAAALALVLSAAPASAGSSAVCHPIATKTKVSLAWGGAGWNEVDRTVAPDDAIAQALDALRESDDTFLHMEVVRRAVVYVSGHGKDYDKQTRRATAARLIALLREDWEETERKSEKAPELRALAALRRFDLAYAAAGLDQVGIDVDVDYDAHLTKALAARKADAPMHLGAALALWMRKGQRGVYENLEIALRGAKEDDLLKKNLVNVAGRVLGTKTLDDLGREVQRKLGRS
jgi:hypothetical protein